MILIGDCRDRMRELAEASVDAVVTDPPYGLEFMGKEWDKFGGTYGWQTGAGFSSPGIGERKTPWPSFTSANDEFGGANPTCETCGGRARGKKKCECPVPDWRVKGAKPDRTYGRRRQMAAYQESMLTVFIEAIRVLKPGGHLLAFGGTRTFHRLTCAIEDAGFEIRDCLSWLYGQGFPKSLDVSKAIDKAAGATREDLGRSPNWRETKRDNGQSMNPMPNESRITVPASDAARAWSGWGTALKPAWEPIILARKPLVGTVAANVQKHGTGAINVDGCRLETNEEWEGRELPLAKDGVTWGGKLNTSSSSSHPLGRWPANVVLDEEAAEMLDEQSGDRQSGDRQSGDRQSGDYRLGLIGSPDLVRPMPAIAGDSGGASRFFFVSKGNSCENPSPVRSAEGPSFLQNGHGSSAQNDAVTARGPAKSGAGPACTDDSKSYSLFPSDVSSAAPAGNTGTIPTTPTSSESSGSVRLVTAAPINSDDAERAGADSGLGSETRFWYTAKASSADRNDGLDGMPERMKRILNGGIPSAVNSDPRGMSGGGDRLARNHHPTVKPFDLMCWLVRLVTPPNGTVLDPFMGSGSTGVACEAEGFKFIGIEIDPDYVEIAKRRIGNVAPLFDEGKQDGA